MRIKSMMKGMLAVVMAMSMAACSGAPASYVHELGLKFGIHIMRGIHVRQQKSIFLLKEHFLPQTWWQIRPRSADGIRICME